MDEGQCGCGCGETTSIYRGKHRRFVAGHHARGSNNSRFGKPVAVEVRRKIAAANKLAVVEGRNPTAIGGWTHTAKTRRKMSEAHERTGFKARTPRQGVTYKCKSCGKPYYRPQSVKQTNYCSLRCSGVGNCTGEKNPFFGKKHTIETRRKLAASSARQREQAPLLPTKPERAVHEELTRRGVVFETEKVLGEKFCVDVFIPDQKIVIFVDGCYWHACPTHFPNARKPKSDNARIPYLSKRGYKVIILWEHEIHENVSLYLNRSLIGSPPVIT